MKAYLSKKEAHGFPAHFQEVEMEGPCDSVSGEGRERADGECRGITHLRMGPAGRELELPSAEFELYHHIAMGRVFQLGGRWGDGL